MQPNSTVLDLTQLNEHNLAQVKVILSSTQVSHVRVVQPHLPERPIRQLHSGRTFCITAVVKEVQTSSSSTPQVSISVGRLFCTFFLRKLQNQTDFFAFFSN